MNQSTADASAPANTASACWRLVIHRFRLDCGELRGELVLDDATPGLRQMSFGAPAAVWPGPLLAAAGWNTVGRRVRPIGRPETVSVPRRRSHTVDVQFEADAHCPVRIQAYWQVTSPQSIHVQLLATTPLFAPLEGFRLQTLSRLPAGSVLIPTCRGGGTVWVEPKVGGGGGGRVAVPRDAAPRKRTAGSGPADRARIVRPFAFPAVLYRPTGASWSYVELSHPEDCCEIVLRSRGRGTDVGFGLFGVDLEKGVILRGRVWAQLVPRCRDTELAAAQYESLRATPPPLSV